MISGIVVLLAALSSATWIDVPFTRQDKNGCGPASVWMVMEYWGKSSQSLEEIHSILYSKEAGGVFASDIEEFLSERGFHTAAFSGEWNDLTESISRGRPLVVSLEANARGTPLHYVLVVGVDESQQLVLVNDPAQRKLLPMARSDFEQRWEAMNRWTLLAVPKEPAAPAQRALPAPPLPASSDPPLELASIAFRSGDYPEAKRLARRAGPGALPNELSATIHFLEDNLDAALKYWNRNGSPRVRDVQLDFQTRWKPIFLDHTVGISRATVLRESDYLLARKRLDATEAFSRYRFDLNPVAGSDDEFDLSLRAAERPLWNPVAWLRGLAYQTVAPGFTNIAGRGINVESLWRWDINKRRLSVEASGPASTAVRYHAGIDARNEIWDVNGKTETVRKQELRFGLSSVATPRWTWSSATVMVRRQSEVSLQYAGSVEYDVLRIREHRLSLTSENRGQFGRALSGNRRVARTETGLRLDWIPKATGDDYHISVRSRTGRVWGSPFVDELFSVGIDRDDDLGLRGHSTTRDGRKGAGPIGRRYVLWNSEISKTFLERSFFKASIVPFVDVARAGSVFVDTGAELRISIASLATFSVSVGRDLRAGRTLVFTNATR